MTPDSLPASPAAAPAALRVRVWLLVAGLGVVLSAAAAALAALLVGLMSPPAAAALVTGLVVLPLAALVVVVVRQAETARLAAAQPAAVDTLTGVPSRHHFMAQAEREWARVRRYGGGAALVIVEVDRLPRLAEARGPEAAGAVMREVARQVGGTLRGADALARYDGAQLAVWLVNADPTGALDAAERMREKVAALELSVQEQSLNATISVGVAVIRPAQQNLAALVADAEAAVQAARLCGGNCVRAAPIDPSRPIKPGPSIDDNQAAGPGFQP